MADDIECAPGVFAFIAERPRFRQITQKGIESGGGAIEKRYGVGQVMGVGFKTSVAPQNAKRFAPVRGSPVVGS